jgi:hypothetical protein
MQRLYHLQEWQFKGGISPAAVMTAAGLKNSADGACDSYALGKFPEDQALSTMVGYTGTADNLCNTIIQLLVFCACYCFHCICI